jgi:hypothetical protein
VAVLTFYSGSVVPCFFGSTPQSIKTACQVLRSFYGYLLFHSVCNEYRDSIDAARKLCDTAESELTKTTAAGLALPGSFNCAASTIFCGSKAGTYTGDKEWAIQLKEQGVDLGDPGLMDQEARITFRTGVAILGTDEQQSMLDTQAVRVLKDDSFGLQVIAIHPADEFTKEFYDAANSRTKDKITLQPLGKLVCRSWEMEDLQQYDLPKDKYPTGRPFPKTQMGEEYVFWIEDDVLDECFVGMKMDARVLVLEGGIAILDDVRETMCSFYKWLPNELWMARHPKEVVVRSKAVAGVDGAGNEQVEGDRRENGGEEMDDDFDD